MKTQPYKVDLEIFQGPMDLLVHLIRKDEVDIQDIPIASITEQFLQYIDILKALDIDFAGDFLVMAATLAKIKSKTLLPAQENDEEEDPRMEIVRPLMEYIQMKEAAEKLHERDILGDKTFVRSIKKKDLDFDPGEQMIKVGLFELIDAFQKILENVSIDKKLELTADRISVKDRITEILELLEKKGNATFTELFASNINKNEVIVTFLAILEMVKLNLVQIAQHIQTGVIRLFYI